MVLFVAETYRLDEASALQKLPAGASDWVVSASLGVVNTPGGEEILVDVGRSWVDQTREPVVDTIRRVQIDAETGDLHLNLHSHSRNTTTVLKTDDDDNDDDGVAPPRVRSMTVSGDTATTLSNTQLPVDQSGRNVFGYQGWFVTPKDGTSSTWGCIEQKWSKQNLTTRLYDVCFGRKPTSSERRKSEAAMSDKAGWAGETARVVAQSVAQIVSSTAAALKTDDDNEVAELPVKVDLGSLAPMNMMWQECVGSGHAALWSRADWREHVAIVSREIGFRYIRGHGILDNSVMFYDACPNDGKHEHSNPVGQPGDTASCIPDKNQSTGSYWDAFSAYDYMLSVGAKPIVELSFTPNPLVDQWRPGMPNPSECDHFHYSSCELPPTNLTRYQQLIGKFARALLDRYGADEMRLWKFEVYNEADLHWKFPQYASMYRAAATALKAVHPDLQVGGPASAQPAWVGLLISYCQNMGVPLDFVTTHAYPNETSSLQSQMTQLRVAQRLADTGGGKPLLITEWSSGGTGWVTLPDGNKAPPMHDEWQMAAWIIAAVLNATDTPGVSLAAYSYWALSDVFTEQGLPQSNISFSGNWGLVNIFGVRKPSFRAFQMLSNAGSTRAALTLGHATNPDLHAVALLDGKDLAASKTLTILVANHACRHRCPKPSAVRLNISITTGAGNTGRIYLSRVATVYRINATSGNPKAAWEKQGAPDYPSPRQIKAIHSASNVKKSTHSISWWEHTAKVPDIVVEPYSLVAVRIDLTLPPSDVAVAFAGRGDLASAPTKCTGESAGLLSQDCDAWQALFNATNGEHWKHCSGPAGFTDPCACDGAKHFGTGLLCKANAITSLELTMNNLVGSIPAAISQMQALNMLSLPGNHLSGAIPAAIGEMPSLKFLNLWNNHLSGTVPALPFSQYTEECCLTGPKNSGMRDNTFTCPLPPDSKKCVVSGQSGVWCTKALVATAAQIDDALEHAQLKTDDEGIAAASALAAALSQGAESAEPAAAAALPTTKTGHDPSRWRAAAAEVVRPVGQGLCLVFERPQLILTSPKQLIADGLYAFDNATIAATAFSCVPKKGKRCAPTAGTTHLRANMNAMILSSTDAGSEWQTKSEARPNCARAPLCNSINISWTGPLLPCAGTAACGDQPHAARAAFDFGLLQWSSRTSGFGPTLQSSYIGTHWIDESGQLKSKQLRRTIEVTGLPELGLGGCPRGVDQAPFRTSAT
eukprot:COSAG01_NODE_244_length_20489_cov_21.366748_5_plen_1217_part_00